MGVRWKAASAGGGGGGGSGGGGGGGTDDSGAPRLCVSVASSVGVGVFLIVGYVAKHVAGPATLVSIVIAALIALLSALCNIELSQRLPRKASPYTFSHVCLGRFASFLTGWTLIMEYAVAFAVVAKGVGLYIDTLLEDAMQTAFRQIAPLTGGSVLGTYFDFFAAAVVLVVGAVFLVDVKRRKWVDSGSLIVSVAVVIFIITAGSFNANPVNWTANVDSVATDGDGGDQQPPPPPAPARGFFPFGVMATFRGAALCTFAFIGIEMLMRSKRVSQRSVSYIGILSFSMIFLSLLGCSVVLTLMWPHNEMHVNVPFPYAFAAHQFNLAKWIVSIAAIVILSTSLWTLMFPLKRQILTLAEDGLLPFAEDNRRALGATLVTIVTISSLFAGLFSMGQLIDLLSVGTLLMFIVVAVAIVMLRFSHQLEIGSISTIDVAELRAIDFNLPATQPRQHSSSFSSAFGGASSGRNGFGSPGIASISNAFRFGGGGGGGSSGGAGGAPVPSRTGDHKFRSQNGGGGGLCAWLRQICGRASDAAGGADHGHFGAGAGGGRRPTRRTFLVVKWTLAIQLAAMLGTVLTVRYAEDNIYNLDVWAVVVAALFVAVVVAGALVTAWQPQRINKNYYKVPAVSVTATVALFASVMLVGMLDYAAWVRFLIWVAIGLPVFAVARRRRRDRKWRTTGGISKIQGMHNRGYVGGGEGGNSSFSSSSGAGGGGGLDGLQQQQQRMNVAGVPGALAVQTAQQMVEITEVDETELLDAYVMPKPAPVDGSKKRSLADESAEANNNNNSDDNVVEGVAAKRAPSLQHSSRTPSPSSSFDDIVLASDIIESLSERKEPNGKTYYVDDVNAVALPPAAEAIYATVATSKAAPPTQEIDDTKQDELVQTKSADSDETPTSTVAMVHKIAEDDINEEDKVDEVADEQPIQLVSVQSGASNFDYGDQLKRLDSESSEDDRMPTGKFFIHDDSNSESGSEPDAESTRTKRTLDIDVAPLAVAAVAVAAVAAIDESGDTPAKEPSIPAENDFKERLSMLLGQNRSLGRQTSAHVTKLEAVSSDSDLSATAARLSTAPRFTVTDVVSPESEEQTAPPPAPVFIPHLYHSVSTRLPTPDYDTEEADGKSAVPDAAIAASEPVGAEEPTENLTGRSSTSSEPDASELKVSIRAKLENILSRGPPVRVSLNMAALTDRPVTPPVVLSKPTTPVLANVRHNVTAASNSPQVQHEIVADRRDHEQPIPSETVKDDALRQQTLHRVAFKNVLRSIAVDISPKPAESVFRRSGSPKPATIEEARNSLRHVENTIM